jgi:glycosyltransferase involved in cell wall biosynthesis
MKISFVIPAYNEEGYINLCLNALVREIATEEAQEAREGNAGNANIIGDYEIIVADNNSTDRTCAIVEEYAAKYPFISLLHEPRRGANSAREAGFAVSKGNLVAFLDADTELFPGWINRAEHVFAKDPHLVCLSGPFIYYDLPLLARILVKFFYGMSYIVYLVNNFIIRNTSVIQGGTEIVRRDALKKIGGHDVNLTFYGDDADLARRLSKVGEVRFSFAFAMRSSGRRLAKEGTMTMGLRYALNYFWVTLFNKPFTTTSKEVRFESDKTVYRPESKTREFLSAGAFAVFFICAFAILIGAAWLAILIVRLKIW